MHSDFLSHSCLSTKFDMQMLAYAREMATAILPIRPSPGFYVRSSPLCAIGAPCCQSRSPPIMDFSSLNCIAPGQDHRTCACAVASRAAFQRDAFQAGLRPQVRVRA